jgi:RNA polymerase sigma-70 factor (ECF subfamily)
LASVLDLGCDFDGRGARRKTMKKRSLSGHSLVVDLPAQALAAPISRRSYAGPRRDAMNAEALFRAHAPFVAKFVARLGVETAAVDDVVQEVFLTVHRIGGYQAGAAKPTTWLAEIALRVVSTHKRSARRVRVVPDQGALDRAVSTSPGPEEVVHDRAALDRVQRALDRLDDDRRAVFVLFELMGERCEDIASGLGIPIGTVFSRLSVARREFQKAHERLVRAADEGGLSS